MKEKGSWKEEHRGLGKKVPVPGAGVREDGIVFLCHGSL